MATVLHDNWQAEGRIKNHLHDLASTEWSTKSKDDKKYAAFSILRRIESSEIGKGMFAQALAAYLALDDKEFAVPEYIRKAIIWACGSNPDES